MMVFRLLLFVSVMIAGVAAPHSLDAAEGGVHAEQAAMACPGCPEGHASPGYGASACDLTGHCLGPWLRREEWLLAAGLQRTRGFRVFSDAPTRNARPDTETPPPRRV